MKVEAVDQTLSMFQQSLALHSTAHTDTVASTTESFVDGCGTCQTCQHQLFNIVDAQLGTVIGSSAASVKQVLLNPRYDMLC